jgi:hypothetical protein
VYYDKLYASGVDLDLVVEEELLKKTASDMKKMKEEFEELMFLKYAADKLRELRKELLTEKYD